MISEAMTGLGKKRSTIREIFEYGNQRAKIVGRENIFDFSLGNPSVAPPDCVTEEIRKFVSEERPEVLHGYTSATGLEWVRQAMADSLNSAYGTNFNKDCFYMTVGAAASLCIVLKAIACPGDEFIVPAPYFPEYKCWIENTANAKCVLIPADPTSFQINFGELEKSLSENTKAVIINSPNNPSGAVYSEETVKKLASVLEDAEKKWGHPIYLISDEPYREIVFDGFKRPFVTRYYKNTFICYSFSKSLSLPGERIGYVLIPDEMEDNRDVYAAVCGAGRILGYVNAPSLFQRVVGKCVGKTADISIYNRNRDVLYNGLIESGYSCVKPQGAFYMFPKAPEENEYAFCEKAKKYDLLLVPGTDFGCPGHVRIAYCVQTETIERALPVFKKLAADYGIR
jgi:aspartate aminotransferase